MGNESPLCVGDYVLWIGESKDARGPLHGWVKDIKRGGEEIWIETDHTNSAIIYGGDEYCDRTPFWCLAKSSQSTQAADDAAYYEAITA